MIYTLVRSRRDPSMVELWSKENNRSYLACVIHEDMFDYDMRDELVDFNEVEISITIKGDKA